MAVSSDILRSYRAPRAVVRELLSQGRREDRAMVFLLVACFLIFVAQWPRLARVAQAGEEIPLSALVAGAAFGWLFLAPLAFYGFAALVHFVAWLLGGGGDMYAARLVTFWSLLAASPLWLAQGLLAGLTGPGAAAFLGGLAVLAVFAGFLLAGMREAALEPPAASA